MSWSTTLYGCPSGYKVWTDYVKVFDPVIFYYPKGGTTGASWSAGYGTAAQCADRCNNEPMCQGFSRSSSYVWDWSPTANPDDPNSPFAQCQLYRSYKADTDTFQTVAPKGTMLGYGSGPSRYYQKVTKDCVYSDPGPSACTTQCTRNYTITQQPQAGGTACPGPIITCNNNEGLCCNQVLTGSSAGRGVFSKNGDPNASCTLTCNSGYWGLNCTNWCPRTGGWGKDWPADGSATGCAAYTYQGTNRVIVQPTSKTNALLYTSDGWGGSTSAGTPNSACNGAVTCDTFPNGLGYWYTNGSDPNIPCRYLACNNDIPVDRGSRNPLAACAATCSSLSNGRGRWSGSSCGTLSCYLVTITRNGVTSTAGYFGGTNCDTLTCNPGYTKTIAGDRCCPTPAGVTNPQIYTDTNGYCIVNNCPRLANDHGQTTSVPDQGCTGTPVCDRLPSGKGGWTGSDCGTMTCDTDLAPYAFRTGSDCLTVICNRITNGTYGPPGVCTGTPICDRLPNNLGIYSLFSSGSIRSCSPSYIAPICDAMANGTRLPGPYNDCTQIVCNTALNGVRTGPLCTLSCNPGYTLTSSGSKCCKTVAGATSYDETTCNPVTDCILKPAAADDYWSICNATTCGGMGIQTRTRVIDVQATYGGRACAATLNRSTETDPTRLAAGAITETRFCTKTCTDMKELPKDIADSRCISDTNCKIIGFEEQSGFSLYRSGVNSTSSPFDFDAVYIKSGQSAPSNTGTVIPTGYTTQVNKKYSNVAPVSTYANPIALLPGDCVRVQDQCTLDSKCVGFDLNNQTNLCTSLLTNSPGDLSNTQLWTSTTDATRTTYIKS